MLQCSVCGFDDACHAVVNNGQQLNVESAHGSSEKLEHHIKKKLCPRTLAYFMISIKSSIVVMDHDDFGPHHKIINVYTTQSFGI